MQIVVLSLAQINWNLPQLLLSWSQLIYTIVFVWKVRDDFQFAAHRLDGSLKRMDVHVHSPGLFRAIALDNLHLLRKFFLCHSALTQ